MYTALPACILNSDGHGRLQRLAGAADEARSIQRAGESEEEGRTHVDEDDAPEDLADSERNCSPGVPSLCSCDCHGLASSIERGAKDKDLSHTAKAVGEGAWVVPVAKAQGVLLTLEST